MIQINPKIFRAYDIRGLAPKDINQETAYLIGQALVKFLSEKNAEDNQNKQDYSKIRIAIGQDARLTSPEIFKGLVKGITETGANVLDLGLIPTDLFYFSVNYLQSSGGAMITASHNSKEYNGIKLTGKKGKIISQTWGMERLKQKIQELAGKGIIMQNKQKQGEIKQITVLSEYLNHVWQNSSVEEFKSLKVVVDFSNGPAGVVFKMLKEKVGYKQIPLDLVFLNQELDGSFLNHSPNPLKPESHVMIQKKIRVEQADFGLLFDGDGDRTIFFDEKGNVINGDITIALFSKYYLKKYPKGKIAYNLTCSKIVPETIQENRGEAIKTKTGTAFMKNRIKKESAIFGGEISGHLYYPEVFCNESGGLSLFRMAEILSFNKESNKKEKQKLSELIQPLKKYFKTEEINFELKDKKLIKDIFQVIEEKYSDGEKEYLDGLTITFKDYWFNLRASNTEPLLRLVVEANSKEEMEKEIEKIRRIVDNSQKSGKF